MSALSNAATTLIGGAGMCTHFVLVAEYVDAEGGYVVASMTDGDERPWLYHGLLNYVMENGLLDDEELPITFDESDEDN